MRFLFNNRKNQLPFRDAKALKGESTRFSSLRKDGRWGLL
jgi:hypothetical protein